MKRVVIRIFVTVFTAGLITALLSGLAFAEEFTVIKGKYGLEIHVPKKTVNTGNLAPGDVKASYLKIANKGSESFTLYMKTDIHSEGSPEGGLLADIMTLTIKDGDGEDGSIIVDGESFRNAAERGSISLGKMAPGSEKDIYFFTKFPETAGNEYQGASFKVNWIFTAQISGGGNGGNGGGNGGNGGSGDKDPSKRPPGQEEEEPISGGESAANGEALPGGEPEPSQPPVEPGSPVVEIIGEEFSVGVPDMPQTGRGLSYPFYVVGALILIAGISMVFKKKK